MLKNIQNNSKLKFIILGSGTSSGIPTVSCNCKTCTSEDSRDKRLRASLLIQSETTNVVIDASPDFRQQMLQQKLNKLDAVVFTHQHFDHIGGFDDLRAFNYTSKNPIDIFLNETTSQRLKRTFYYAFETPEQIGGGIPLVNINIIGTEPFTIGDIKFQPIPLLHGKLDVLGFRINDFAYCTDTNYIPKSSIDLLQNLKVLVLDALRYTEHSTHFSLSQAIIAAEILKPEKTYFTHIAHQIKHSECKLPEGFEIAYDGLEIII